MGLSRHLFNRNFCPSVLQAQLRNGAMVPAGNSSCSAGSSTKLSNSATGSTVFGSLSLTQTDIGGNGGGSAGAGLAAGLALIVRDRGEIPVIFQLLTYPMIDDRFVTVSSTMDTIGWTVAASRLGWSAYLGVPPGSDGVSPYAAPARAADLSGLPPAFICVGALDIFRDEDIEYARRLSDAGIPTELHVYPGVPHAFEISAPGIAVSMRFSRDVTDALGTAFGRAGS